MRRAGRSTRMSTASLTPNAPPTWGERIDRHSGRLMVLPAVIVLLCFAIFPLIISAYLALSRFALAPGGFTLKFVGLLNFRKLLVGSPGDNSSSKTTKLISANSIYCLISSNFPDPTNVLVSGCSNL